jgi:ATP-dependent helicase HrpB
VFLPGQREIQSCGRALGATPWAEAIDWVGLHGNLSLPQQSRAIAPARSGRGKLVLATSIAESSLTIAGVRLVIDAGLSRRNRFDPVSGMDALVTVPASLASAEQRAGRAGRLGPGACVRLWSPADQRRRPAHDPPELQEADPLPLALQLAWWGDPCGEQLAWLNPPRPAALAEARQLLRHLDALDGEGRLTRHGRRLAELGLPPRLGHMLLVAERWGAERLASELAVLLSERDPLERAEAGSDLLARLDWLRRQAPGHPLRRLQSQWLQRSGGQPRGQALAGEPDWAARLVAAAYPERVALARQDGRGRYLMRSGRGAVLHPGDPLQGAEALAIAGADGGEQNARIHLAVPMPREHLAELAQAQGSWRSEARWDPAAGRVRCEQRLRLDALVLERRPWPDADGPVVVKALLEGLRTQGIGALSWTAATRQLRHRLQIARRHLGPPWPDCGEEHLSAELETWLGPHLEGCRSLEDLRGLDLSEALWQGLDWSLRPQLERLLPERLPVPTGRLVRIDYSTGEPVLAVKLQELFGAAQGPAVLDGQLPVTLHLLTPAGRPAAITQDLAGFWAGGYREVRRELRGRYPKHPWPDDAANASPTALTKARLAAGRSGRPPH